MGRGELSNLMGATHFSKDHAISEPGGPRVAGRLVPSSCAFDGVVPAVLDAESVVVLVGDLKQAMAVSAGVDVVASLFSRLYLGRCWLAGGLTWRAFLDVEELHLRGLDPGARHEHIEALRAGGMSVRPIADVLGITGETVARAVRDLGLRGPVMGTDGKVYGPSSVTHWTALEQTSAVAETLGADPVSQMSLSEQLAAAEKRTLDALTALHAVEASFAAGLHRDANARSVSADVRRSMVKLRRRVAVIDVKSRDAACLIGVKV